MLGYCIYRRGVHLRRISVKKEVMRGCRLKLSRIPITLYILYVNSSSINRNIVRFFPLVFLSVVYFVEVNEYSVLVRGRAAAPSGRTARASDSRLWSLDVGGRDCYAFRAAACFVHERVNEKALGPCTRDCRSDYRMCDACEFARYADRLSDVKRFSPEEAGACANFARRNPGPILSPSLSIAISFTGFIASTSD